MKFHLIAAVLLSGAVSSSSSATEPNGPRHRRAQGGSIIEGKNEACPHCSHCYHEYDINITRGFAHFKTLDVSFQDDDPLNQMTDFTLRPSDCSSCLDNQLRGINYHLRNLDNSITEQLPDRLWISNPGGIVTGVAWDHRYTTYPTVAMSNASAPNEYVHPCDETANPASAICASTKGPEADGDPIFMTGWEKNPNINPAQIFGIVLYGCDYWPEKKEVTNTWILAHFPDDPAGWVEFQVGASDLDDCYRSHVSPNCIDPPAETLPEGQSVAEKFVRVCLNAIRLSIPDPPLHARNLYHLHVAMYDGWIAYDDAYNNTGVLFNASRITPTGAERNEAVAFAAYRLLRHRYTSADGTLAAAEKSVIDGELDTLMDTLGYDKSITSLVGNNPSAVGNRVAHAVIDHFINDGSGEPTYNDITNYTSVNEPLYLNTSGTVMSDPNKWQPLSFEEFITQNEIEVGAWTQEIQGPHWGHVTPFAMDASANRTYLDGLPVWLTRNAPPTVNTSEAAEAVLEVIQLNSLLNLHDETQIDISPGGSLHNNTLGTNDGGGYAQDPFTNLPYESRNVRRADYGRVVAEFWADGPDSETPPGHWNVIAQAVRHHPNFTSHWMGDGGAQLDDLEWDVKCGLVLNGALHDAAIAAWSNKRYHDYSRPISQIRYMGGLGQRTNTSDPSYHPWGLPLENGLVEIITNETSASNMQHEHLSDHVGEIAVLNWRPPSANGVEWIRAVDWMPYQRATFVTPAFPGYVSGHSSFSRAAAEVLSAVTGDPYFPGGLSEDTIKRGDLAFDYGPETDVTLSHATYYDAADEAGRSRLWGGIHPVQDDLPGRELGAEVGKLAVSVAAERYFVPAPMVTQSPVASPNPTPSPILPPTPCVDNSDFTLNPNRSNRGCNFVGANNVQVRCSRVGWVNGVNGCAGDECACACKDVDYDCT